MTKIFSGTIGFLICIVVLNFFYKKTNHYYNNFTTERNYFRTTEINCVQMVVTGTSNALAATASFQKNEKILILARKQQGFKLDRFLLENCINQIKVRAKVFIFVSPCTFLFNQTLKKDLLNHSSVILENVASVSFIGKIRNAFPIVRNPKLIKYILFDTEKNTSFYSRATTTISKKQAKSKMYLLTNNWKKLFKMDNFDSNALTSTNFQAIQENKNEVQRMVEKCYDYSLKPYLVVTPFSKELTAYFSSDFIAETLENPICDIVRETKVAYLDFMNDPDFINSVSLFSDGGFVLNKMGSEIFMKKLIKKSEEVE